MFLSSEVIGYCGTTEWTYLHLSDIAVSSYLHLNELLLRSIRQVYPALHENIHVGKYFISGFVNNTMVENPNVVPNAHDLNSDMTGTFLDMPVSVRCFLTASYDEEVNDRATGDLAVPYLNASQTKYICHVLLDKKPLDNYTIVRRRMTSLIGPQEMGKTKTII